MVASDEEEQKQAFLLFSSRRSYYEEYFNNFINKFYTMYLTVATPPLCPMSRLVKALAPGKESGMTSGEEDGVRNYTLKIVGF